MQLFVATKAIIVNREGKILMLREKPSIDGTQAGVFTIPGGRIASDESYEDGLAREVREECGLSIKPLHIIGIGEWWPKPRGEEWHVVALFLECILEGSDIVILSDEHDEYQWIDPDRYAEIGLVTSEHHIIEKFIEHRALYGSRCYNE